jgi:uncharacterized protein (DUF983 family)
MRDPCPRCGLRFEREEGFFLGAYVINFALMELAVGVFIAVAFAVTLPDPPVWGLIAMGLPLAVLFPVLTYPFSKTIWVAFDLYMRDRR